MIKILTLWSVSYLNKAFFIDIKLVRERFKIYGFFNVASLLLVLSIILFGGKTIIFMKANYQSLSLLLTFFLIMIGMVSVFPQKIDKLEQRMFSFFPSIGLKNIRNYYLYRKLIFSYMFSIYVLFPFSTKLTDITMFLFSLSMLSFFMLINIITGIFFSEAIVNSFLIAIRLLFAIFLALMVRNMLPFDLHKWVFNIGEIFLIMLNIVLVLFNFYYLSKGKIKTSINLFRLKKVQYNNLFFLFLIRSKIKYDIVFLIVISFLPLFLDKKYDEPLIFVITMLTSLYLVYYEYLKKQSKSINFLYNANNLGELRKNAIISLDLFSILFLFIAVILGVFSDSLLQSLFYYIFVVSSFSLSNVIVSINLEKRMNSKIFIMKDVIKSLSLSVLILSILIYVFKLVSF